MALKFMRGFRYFIWLLILLGLVILIMWLTKTLNLQQGQSVWDMIVSRKGALIVAVLLFLAISYPLTQFAKRTVDADLDQDLERIKSVFAEFGYVQDRKESGKVVFRAGSAFRRVRLNFNDEITVLQSDGAVELEGMKRDMYRIHSKLTSVFGGEAVE